jgi:hypothetical protein
MIEYPLLVKDGCTKVEEFIITETIKRERKAANKFIAQLLALTL